MHWKEATDNVLNRLVAKTRLGLISDVDGTLSPIVDQPDKAHVTARNLDLLAELSDDLALVALISGRAAEDLRQRVGLPGIIYVGNHGLERWVGGKTKYQAEALVFLPALQAALKELQSIKSSGVFIEDKGITISLHYRQSPAPEQFIKKNESFLVEIATRYGLKLSSGRKVFEFKPPIQFDKGSAFRQLVDEAKLDGAIYLGDDTTDVTALSAAKEMREEGICEAWGISVQSVEAPAEVEATADLWALGVPDVEDFLDWLLNARRASST